MSKSESVLALSDEDFMAQLLGVKTDAVTSRAFDVEEQLHMQLSSINLQRAVSDRSKRVVHDFTGMPNEHILSRPKP